MNRTMIIGHRGAAMDAPENTLVAFQKALEQGAEGLELDIHLSADGEIVVCHDSTVNRTTDGTGAIRAMTVSDLKKLDAGVRYGEAFRGERIPLLSEVFEAIPKQIMINIEVKNVYDGLIEGRLVDLLKRSDRLESVVVSSFRHQSLVRLKKLEPELKVGILYDELYSHKGYADLSPVPLYSLHPHYINIGDEDIRELRESGYEVYVYTVNDEQSMRRMIASGVSGIITDCPGKLKKLMLEEA
ncbi:glycerophosphodiester phosphodiesterase [Paenibacillus sp. J2TS4]|uniref:glycerophosphodiester phosphodiesterase n=1 Tax=Paenibacillus sp. J2TS4 TaxID=2807194 RepID=UPI001B0CA1F4|nr:glycerophosphodiester phosphodiesterase [Paenibacillus sp. J2TS4]GIP35713.1 glycerophosphoryl diester phosphodiesterase [Paenibacillus sp. J2TS4]